MVTPLGELTHIAFDLQILSRTSIPTTQILRAYADLLEIGSCVRKHCSIYCL